MWEATSNTSAVRHATTSASPAWMARAACSIEMIPEAPPYSPWKSHRGSSPKCSATVVTLSGGSTNAVTASPSTRRIGRPAERSAASRASQSTRCTVFWLRFSYGVCPTPMMATRSEYAILDHLLGAELLEVRIAEPELGPVDGVIVLPDPPARPPHRSRSAKEPRHHALHPNVAEVVVGHLDD